MPILRTNVTFQAGEIQLEGILGYDSGTDHAPGVIICHPHPQMGGSMDNNVVYALFDQFAGQGYVSFAFNFRGTGRSRGRHEGGEGEIKDVEGAVQYLEGLEKTKNHGLGLLGYSFGAWVGLRAALGLGDRIRCAGAVAPPTGILPFDSLEHYQSPFYFVVGDRDAFCSVEKQEDLLKGPAGKRGRKLISGADHFFLGREKEAAVYLCDRFRFWLPPGT